MTRREAWEIGDREDWNGGQIALAFRCLPEMVDAVIWLGQ